MKSVLRLRSNTQSVLAKVIETVRQPSGPIHGENMLSLYDSDEDENGDANPTLSSRERTVEVLKLLTAFTRLCCSAGKHPVEVLLVNVADSTKAFAHGIAFSQVEAEEGPSRKHPASTGAWRRKRTSGWNLKISKEE